jgi:hypothetical protein
MNIQTVITNLKNTIAGKEKMLESMNPNNPYSNEFLNEGEVIARRATIEFLKINITELKRILQDVEQCIPKESEPYRNADSGLYGPEYQGQ